MNLHTQVVQYFRDEAETLAKKLKVKFYRTSVKEDLNVTEGWPCPLAFFVIWDPSK